MIGEVDVWSLSSYDEGIPQDLFTTLRHEAPVYRHADPLVPEGHWAIGEASGTAKTATAGAAASATAKPPARISRRTES